MGHGRLWCLVPRGRRCGRVNFLAALTVIPEYADVISLHTLVFSVFDHPICSKVLIERCWCDQPPEVQMIAPFAPTTIKPPFHFLCSSAMAHEKLPPIGAGFLIVHQPPRRQRLGAFEPGAW